MRAATTTRVGPKTCPSSRRSRRPSGRRDSHKKWTDARGPVTVIKRTATPSPGYLATDGQGNITTVTGTAAVQCTARFDPFGTPAGASGTNPCNTGTTDNDAFYRGARRDKTTGNYQFGSRTYDPAKAAFLTPDTYRNAHSNADLSIGVDPLTRNRYTYVNGDPINFIDPDGHEPRQLSDGSYTKPPPSRKERQYAARKARERMHAQAVLEIHRTFEGWRNVTNPNGGQIREISKVWENVTDERFWAARHADKNRPPGAVAELSGIADVERCVEGEGSCGWAVLGIVPFGRLAKLGKLAKWLKRADNVPAPNTAGVVDDVVGPSVRYNRGAHYGGAQTNSPAGRALREGAEGTACPSCGRPQISGTNTAPVPEHSPSLLEHYYGGGHAMTDAQRRAYARSADAFDGTMCLTCQRSQGGSLSQLSRWYAELWGL